MSGRPVRVLWLLNHTTLRRFEVGQLRALGITEIFSPKRFPYDEGNLSASVDETLDASLTIPVEELQILNREDWYAHPSRQAWDIANQYFDIAMIGFFPEQIASCVRHFRGSVILRVFGLAKGHSYTKILADALGPAFFDKLRNMGNRFWFGAGYAHLIDEEGDVFRRRNCFLPVGLEGELKTQAWRGSDKRIFFVCPRIGTSPYFNAIYRAFTNHFSGLDYVIGGAQPIRVEDSRVLGFVSQEEHERNMREMRVMFYHSSEPNHVHYHPFEAIQAGMPLVFMADGMLDRLGGTHLPGRCKTIREAREKIARILDDDWQLIETIRNSQLRLLKPVRPENCAVHWQANFQRILDTINKAQAVAPSSATQPYRIAVIVPTGYRGGSLRGAKLLATAIETGARLAGHSIEIILGHLDDPVTYSEDQFSDLPSSIKKRPYTWRTLKRPEARRAMAYAGLPLSSESENYLVPDDGIRQFMDCGLWIIVSDRLEHPVLPLRPYALMVYDYLQRYEPLLPQAMNERLIRVAHAAERVFVTTEFTRRDALRFAGLPKSKVVKLPMLAPAFSLGKVVKDDAGGPAYFLWTTNLAPHKNHENAFKALQLYYEMYGGMLECHISGVDTKNLLKSNLSHLKPLHAIANGSAALTRQLRLLGELPDHAYQRHLAGAAFLWHTARIDNGTFSVVESAHLGVPSLSSDYPAMREIDAQFQLNLAWMDSWNPEDMAYRLKKMETEADAVRGKLPSAHALAMQSIEQLAPAYWEAVRRCL
ncbi:MAG TPA: hypothetical protein VF427_14010 [Noviherbaspirillum sp.]